MNFLTGTLLLIPNRKYQQSLLQQVVTTYTDIKHTIFPLHHLHLHLIHFFRSPLLWSMVFMFICLYWNCVFQIYADSIADRWKYKHQNIVLTDIAFDLLPHLSSTTISDEYIKYCFLTTCFRFFLSPLRSIICRRYCFLQGIIFLCRGFSVFATLLPNPLLTCESTARGNPFIEAFYVLSGKHVTCADLLFSGHAANITLCVLIWNRYGEIVPIMNIYIEKIFVWCCAFGGYFIFVANHFHYSCDVFIGGLLASMLFYVYHYYLLTISTRNNFFNSFLRWFEEDATDVPKLVKLGNKKQILHI
ncbi:Sphingomyelin synthetase [Entamoeba marina]